MKTKNNKLHPFVKDSDWYYHALRQSVFEAAWALKRLDNMLDGGPPAPNKLAARLVLFGGADRSPRLRRIINILVADKNFCKAFSTSHLPRAQPSEAQMQPLPTHLSTLPLPQLPTQHDLAQWLNLSKNDLDWFAGINRRYSSHIETKINHYHYE